MAVTKPEKEHSSDSDSSSGSSSSDEDEDVKLAVTGEKRELNEDSAPASKKIKTDEGAVAVAAADSTTCFIGNLAFTLDEDSVWGAFDEWVGAGSVKGVRLISDRDTGRPKGFGYVEFNTAEQAQSALKFTDTDLNGRQIRVDLSIPKAQKTNNHQSTFHTPSNNPPASSLFLGNLSFDVYEENVRGLFEPHGVITSIRIPTDIETGAPKGFGYIEFSTVEEAVAAQAALNGVDLFGRGLRIDFAAPRAGAAGAGRGRGGSRGKRGSARGGSRGGFKSEVQPAGSRIVFE